MTSSENMITVRVNVDITAASLQAIVAAARKSVGPDEKGFYHVDTADWTGRTISDFLKKNDFESYTRRIEETTGNAG